MDEPAPVPRIKGAIRREESLIRLGGDACGFITTWLSDDRQFVSACDGGIWPEVPKSRYWSTHLLALTGDPHGAGIEEIESYPQMPLWSYIGGLLPPYYGMSMLAVDGRIYQYLSTSSRGFKVDGIDGHWNGAKLIYSPNNGRTWCNQDGSTPVMLEPYQSQSHQSIVFLDEPQKAFSLLTFLQMGRDYRDNLDGYVYVYSPNGITDETMTELVMFRAPKAKLLQRETYEYFAGMCADGSAHWTRSIDQRQPVASFPCGLMSRVFPMAWLPCVAYNAALGVYMMVNSNSTDGVSTAPRPTYLGIWLAPNPWGPWRQIHEEKAWLPGGDANARAAWPQIPPRWIAADGRSFWLVWTDVQSSTSADGEMSPIQQATEKEWMGARRRWREAHPYFAFNAQRVDLTVE